jgi:hypothetical protein
MMMGIALNLYSAKSLLLIIILSETALPDHFPFLCLLTRLADSWCAGQFVCWVYS